RSVTEELGRGYWRGLLKRNKHLIASKKQLNLTPSVLSGALTSTCRKCMKRCILHWFLQS
ncbi:MAG: hypothetical protein ACK53Y_04890, partial [bacterium]